MTLLHLSDTHGQHEALKLPEADIIVHSGDFTMGGSEQEAIDFIHWFCDLPYKHKVFVAGNHDDCLCDAKVEGLPKNVHYLCGTSCTIEGLHFHGIPLFMADVQDGNLQRMYAEIPQETNILITHEPPYGFCDWWNKRHVGSKELRKAVESLPNLKYHLFGHQHDSYGTTTNGTITFSNAALIDCNYKMTYIPKLIEL